MIDATEIHDLAIGLARKATNESAFAFLETTLQPVFQHILFTTLRFDYREGVMTRLYSNREDVSPVGGTKPIPTGHWADLILSECRCYIGYTREDLKDVFFDHEALWAIGCESVMNVPVIWQDRTVGSLNLLGRARQFDVRQAAAMSMLGQLAVPLFLTRNGSP